jgi:hypothetical protein
MGDFDFDTSMDSIKKTFINWSCLPRRMGDTLGRTGYRGAAEIKTYILSA